MRRKCAHRTRVRTVPALRASDFPQRLEVTCRTGCVVSASGQRQRTLCTDEHGTVTVEYTVLLVVVAVACAFAMVAAGVPLVRAYLTRETWLLFPFP